MGSPGRVGVPDAPSFLNELLSLAPTCPACTASHSRRRKNDWDGVIGWPTPGEPWRLHRLPEGLKAAEGHLGVRPCGSLVAVDPSAESSSPKPPSTRRSPSATRPRATPPTRARHTSRDARIVCVHQPMTNSLSAALIPADSRKFARARRSLMPTSWRTRAGPYTPVSLGLSGAALGWCFNHSQRLQ